jgi:hypothetical protein
MYVCVPCCVCLDDGRWRRVASLRFLTAHPPAGILIVDLAAGAMSPMDPRPVASDTLFAGFNFADPLCAIVVSMLEDQGLLQVSAPIAAVWPAFGAHGKEKITLLDLFQHRAGLASYPQGDVTYEQLFSNRSLITDVVNAVPCDPGAPHFHLLSIGVVVAGLVEHVTRGQTLQQFVRQRIAAPLGLQSELLFGPDALEPSCCAAALQPRLAGLDCTRIATIARSARRALSLLGVDGKDAARSGPLAGGLAVPPSPSASAASLSPSAPSPILSPAFPMPGAGAATVPLTPNPAASFDASGFPPPIVPASPQHIEYFRMIAQTQRDVLREALAAPDGDSGWVSVVEKNGVTICKKSVPGNPLNMMRGACVIRRSPDSVLAMVTNKERKAEWDSLFRSARLVEELCPEYEIACDEYKAVWPTSPRDFCTVRGVARLADGTIIAAGKSVTHPRCPEGNGFVRGNVHMAGFVLQPLSPSSTQVIYLSNADVKGSLPTAIVNKVSMEQPMCVAGLRTLVESLPEVPRRPDATAQAAAASVAGAGAQAVEAPKAPRVDISLINAFALDSAVPFFSLRCSARALARVFALLTAGGTLGEKTLLSSSAAERMQTCTAKDSLGVAWGLGLRRINRQDGAAGFVGACSVGGGLVLCDSTHELVVAITTNQLSAHRGAALRVGDYICRSFGLGTLAPDGTTRA